MLQTLQADDWHFPIPTKEPVVNLKLQTACHMQDAEVRNFKRLKQISFLPQRKNVQYV